MSTDLTSPTKRLFFVAALLLAGSRSPGADPGSADTGWFRDGRYGVFQHFLPGDPESLARVEAFDVDALARQLESVGARHLVITLGQNSGYFIAPNAEYDRVTGYAPGERCSRRDLPLDLHRALAPRGIRLMLYLPAQTPNGDPRAQRAFGLPEGPRDQPIDPPFARKWAAVIREWSRRYGEKVSGWWFDGCYEHVRFTEEIAGIYRDAVRRGNPRAIVAFNPGVKVVRWTRAEDYTAGELNEPFLEVPPGRWLDGVQWHALTYLGSAWGRRDARSTPERWAAWVKAVADREGVVTLDAGPNGDPREGPIGAIGADQMGLLRAVRTALGEAPARPPSRLRRAESFLGIHFDFHAGDDCTMVGKNTTREMIERILDGVRPDYIQVDCKGHRGLSSYPTKVGNRAPGFIGDPLRLWREVTAERGVALYLHYSGVWDSEAIRLHPDWGVVDAGGKVDPNATSFFGPYAEKLLVPQLRELAGEYGVDGVWVDGECWASKPDWGEAALKAFHEATGLAGVPRKPGDPGWFEFLQFHREAYRRYLRSYIREVKGTHPDFQICSNWAFTDHMPEPVSAPVDWISGDYSPQDSVNSARFSARYMARQGKPWDLMAWSFTTVPGKDGSNRKTAVQLQREAAAVLSLGGGFQAYFTQERDGSVRLDKMPVMAEVARFCRERQAVCHGAVPVPQVAVLYSTAAHDRESNGLFPRDLSRIRGTLEALLEGQWSVEVLGEHHLAKRMGEYPLIVVPELESLEPGFRKDLVAHAEAGGSLLLVGTGTLALFAGELGVEAGEAAPGPVFLSHDGALVEARGPVGALRPGAKGEPVGRLQPGREAGGASWPAAVIATVGRGKIAAIPFAFSGTYLAGRSAPARSFLGDLARRLFPEPLVEVKGSADVDVAVNRIGKCLAVNLVNTAGPHVTEPIIATIPPVGPLDVTIRTGKKPEAVTLEPGGQRLPFEFTRGAVRLVVPRIDIHGVILVE